MSLRWLSGATHEMIPLYGLSLDRLFAQPFERLVKVCFSCRGMLDTKRNIPEIVSVFFHRRICGIQNDSRLWIETMDYLFSIFCVRPLFISRETDLIGVDQWSGVSVTGVRSNAVFTWTLVKLSIENDFCLIDISPFFPFHCSIGYSMWAYRWEPFNISKTFPVQYSVRFAVCVCARRLRKLLVAGWSLSSKQTFCRLWSAHLSVGKRCMSLHFQRCCEGVEILSRKRSDL